MIIDLLCRFGAKIGAFLPCRNQGGLFFFFNYFHMGGAEKVHADIVACFRDRRPWIFFSLPSRDNSFKRSMAESAKLFNLWYLLLPLHPFSTGIIAGIINRHPRPVVFGCNSLFYYKLIPHLGAHVRKTDLLHAFGGGAENFSLPVAERLDCRIVINERTRDDLVAQYRHSSLDPALAGRIRLIENRIDLPGIAAPRRRAPGLRVLYAGRSSEEKRVHLIGQAANRCLEEGWDVTFTFAGAGLSKSLPELPANCHFLGQIPPDEMGKVYTEADVLVLTSSREGFPVVVMEAMAHGVVPVCTDVGGIPSHVHHGENGFLLYAREESEIVQELVATLRSLSQDLASVEEYSVVATQYARQNFSSPEFCAQYRRAILG